MPRAKKETGIVPAGEGKVVEGAMKLPKSGIGGGKPDFSNILQKEDLTLADKRKAILEQLGMRKPKQKYKNLEERKAAAKERSKARKEKRLAALAEIDPNLVPKKREKMSSEEKKAKRSERRERRLGFMFEMAKANPELAKKFHIDIDKLKERKPKL